jgi:hypothetical protein
MNARPAAEHIAASSRPAARKAGTLRPAAELRRAESGHTAKTLPAAADLGRAKSGHAPRTARRSAEPLRTARTSATIAVIIIVVIITAAAHRRSAGARAWVAASEGWTVRPASIWWAAIRTAVARAASFVITIIISIATFTVAIIAIAVLSIVVVIRCEGSGDGFELCRSDGVGSRLDARCFVVGHRGCAKQAERQPTRGCEQPGCGSCIRYAVTHEKTDLLWSYEGAPQCNLAPREGKWKRIVSARNRADWRRRSAP